MGVGKSTVGRRLARRLGLPFVDSDAEIEGASGFSAAEVFERFGEKDYRDGERRLVARLVDGQVRVISTGGGVFVDPRTRELLKTRTITVWLDAPVEVLAQRTGRREHPAAASHRRPQGDAGADRRGRAARLCRGAHPRAEQRRRPSRRRRCDRQGAGGSPRAAPLRSIGQRSRERPERKQDRGMARPAGARRGKRGDAGPSRLLVRAVEPAAIESSACSTSAGRAPDRALLEGAPPRPDRTRRREPAG